MIFSEDNNLVSAVGKPNSNNCKYAANWETKNQILAALTPEISVTTVVSSKPRKAIIRFLNSLPKLLYFKFFQKLMSY